MSKIKFWNYRVIKSIDDSGESTFAIHEVYYGDNNQPIACTENPVGIISESLEELTKEFNIIKLALEKPFLEMIYFEELSRKKS
jgi:hypothetical protein